MIQTKVHFQVALLAAWFMLGVGTALAAESELQADSELQAESELQVIPVTQYELISLESQTVHSPGGGVIVIGENFLLAGVYSQHLFTQNLDFDYPDTYHSIEMIADVARSRHRYLGGVKSESNRPVVGGLRTFQAAALYGYELVQQPRFSLVLGGGLAVSDFGIDGPGGKPWPLLPVPLIRAAWELPLLHANLDVITGPNLSLTLAPQRQLRATLDARIDNLRDERDIIFEGALVYRFLGPEHPLGDLAGVAVGVKSDTIEFDLETQDDSLELHYYALFGTIDLTVLTISGGYAFNTRVRYQERVTASPGDGWFISVNALFPVGIPRRQEEAQQ